VQLYTTYADTGEVPPERAWSALRALRATPPGRAVKADRRRVFASALEQAEQLFRAAGAVGVATKPLLTFYGLSQAGRAIAAALAQNDWRLSGHGIRIGKRPEGDVRVADLKVEPSPGGSFRRIGDVLGSSGLASATPIGDLWPLLAETGRHRLPGSGDDRSLGLTIDYTGWATGIPTVRVEELPESFTHIGQEHRDLMSGLGADYSAQAEALDRFLSRYPTLSARIPFTAAGQPVGLQPNGDGTCSISFRWPEESRRRHRSVDEFGLSLAVMIRGAWRVYPSLDGSDRPVHPLLVWWAILFRLSMLARYEPDAWDAMTDVNTSADAVPIEHLLGCAMSTVPELIFHVLTSEGASSAERRQTNRTARPK
jgi:hypothetical protein